MLTLLYSLDFDSLYNNIGAVCQCTKDEKVVNKNEQIKKFSKTILFNSVGELMSVYILFFI